MTNISVDVLVQTPSPLNFGKQLLNGSGRISGMIPGVPKTTGKKGGKLSTMSKGHYCVAFKQLKELEKKSSEENRK